MEEERENDAREERMRMKEQEKEERKQDEGKEKANRKRKCNEQQSIASEELQRLQVSVKVNCLLS